MKAFVEYRLTENELQISFDAVANQDTPLCLTNHAYFNLQGSETILDHELIINADGYLPVDASGIPNAPLKKWRVPVLTSAMLKNWARFIG